jgi:hypothetical protein
MSEVLKHIAAAESAFHAADNSPDTGLVIDPTLDALADDAVERLKEVCNARVDSVEDVARQLAFLLAFDREAIDPVHLPIFESAARLLSARS